MKVGRVAMIICGLVILLTMVFLMGIVVVQLVEGITVENTGQTYKTPCIDKMGRPFEDEICIHQRTCSKFGVIGDFKCSEIKQ